jgi:hypothetical protein
MVGVSVAALVAVGVIFALDSFLRADAPSRDECVTLWNAPINAVNRAQVEELEYPAAEIDGAYEEGRYEGCFAIFATGVGEPWALYSAARIPGNDDPLRWRLEVSEAEWGSGFQLPSQDRPQPKAIVEPDGSLSLQ